MRNLLITLLVAAPILLTAQDNSYTMYMTVMLSPENAADQTELETVMKAHNQKFHQGGAYNAVVWNIITGPNTNKLVWMMGPLTFADIDGRPGSTDHYKDWAKVGQHLGGADGVEYWKRDDKLSNVLSEEPSPLIYVRIWKVNNEYGFLVNGLLKQISEAVKAMEGENQWTVWDNEFRQGNLGRHLATVSSMKNFAELDEDDDFEKAFRKVHGDDSWVPFVRTMGLAFEDSYDEIWSLNTAMSSLE